MKTVLDELSQEIRAAEQAVRCLTDSCQSPSLGRLVDDLAARVAFIEQKIQGANSLDAEIANAVKSLMAQMAAAVAVVEVKLSIVQNELGVQAQRDRVRQAYKR